MSNLVRQSVFSGLSLLGFEAPSNVPVDSLFAKGVSSANPKAFESVSMFLLSQCRCVDSHELFRHCWPVLERAHSREFRNCVAKALDILKKNGALPASLQVRRSYFDDCKGERFEQAMLALTTHAISCTMNREYKDCISPIPDELMESSTLESVQTTINEMSNQFKADVSKRDEETKEWLEYGTYLSEEFRRALVELEKLSEIKKDMEAHPVFVDGEGFTEFIEVQEMHTQKLETVRSLWKDCSTWIETNQENMNIISAVMEGRANLHSIDGSNSRIEIPNELAEQFRKDIQAERINPYADGGMLDLVSVIKLWGISIKTVDEVLQTSVLQDSTALIESLENVSQKVEILNGVQASSKAIRNQLTQRRDELEDSVEELKAERQVRIDQENKEPVPRSPETTSFLKVLKDNTLVLPPVTPKLHVRDRMNKAGNVSSHFKKPTLPDGFATSTPDAVNLIRANVRTKVEKSDEKVVNVGLEQSAQKLVFTPKNLSTPDTPASAKAQFGKTPVRKGTGVPVPIDSCLKAKSTLQQGFPLRKKPSTSTIQNQKSSTIPVFGKASIKSSTVANADSGRETKGKGKALPTHNPVDAIVDQIVESIALGREDNVSAGMNSPKKTVRFHDLHAASEPFSALGTTGFQPRAEIARTPLKRSVQTTPSTASKLPMHSKVSTPSAPAAPSTPSLVKSVLKSNLRGTVQASALKSGNVPRPASPSRLATPKRAVSTPSKMAEEITSSKSVSKTNVINQDSSFVIPADRERDGPEWLHAVDELEAFDNLLDEDVPDFMADENPLDGASLIEFPSFSKDLQKEPMAESDQLSTVETQRGAPLAGSGASSPGQSNIFNEISIANPLDEMSIYQSRVFESDEEDNKPTDQQSFFMTPNKELLSSEDRFNREFMFLNEAVALGGNGERDDDEISIMSEVPPASVTHSEDEDEDADDSELLGCTPKGDARSGLARDDVDFDGMEEVPSLRYVADEEQLFFIGGLGDADSEGSDEDVDNEVQSEKLHQPAPQTLEVQHPFSEVDESLDIQKSKSQSIATGSDEVADADIALSSIQLSKSTSKSPIEQDSCLEEAAVGSICFSESATSMLVTEGRVPKAPRNVLADSFEAWGSSVHDPILDDSVLEATHATSQERSAFEQKSLDAILEKSGVMDDERSLQTFDASRVVVDVNPMPTASILDTSSLALPPPIPSSDSALLDQHLIGISNEVSQLQSQMESTSSFDRYAKSPAAHRLLQPSMSTLRIDSGVGEGPDDLSEVPPGHPDPSQVLMSNNSGALSLSMLGNHDGQTHYPVFAVGDVAAAAAAEPDTFLGNGTSGEMRLDDIESFVEEASQILRQPSQQLDNTRGSTELFKQVEENVLTDGVVLDGFLDWADQHKLEDGIDTCQFGVDEIERSFVSMDSEARGSDFGGELLMDGDEPSFLAKGTEEEGEEEETDL